MREQTDALSDGLSADGDRRPRRLASGLILLCIGLPMMVVMGIGMLVEIQADDFFGMMLAAMAAFFGGLLTRDGVNRVFGLKPAREIAVASRYHLKGYAREVGFPEGAPPDPKRCAEVVFREFQCPNPRGHGPADAFCIKHAKDYTIEPAGRS